ncbi:GlcG/HbpS family heme-binding protein [Microbacterium sp. CJ88]|uniref:GlcG/HbpS family heme-binding protein n=1 Tax=Microbacterium sp. CJ88 TaxID=3445672 RepID=UPI003F65AB93
MTNESPAPRTVRALSYAEARVLLDAALEAATRIAVPASVAILDATREVVAFGRQDDAPLLTGEVATAKAYTAASLRQPSGALAEATSPAGPFAGLAHGSARGLITFAGGFPLVVGSDIVGAVGASGGSLEEDETIARAAVALFEEWNR